MSRRRTLPAPVLVITAVVLAAPLVLLHGTYRSLYPIALLVGMALRAIGGRVLQLGSMLLAVALGPFLWHLGAEGGASETFAVLRESGMHGMAEYVRELVIAPAPVRAWILLPLLLLLGFVVADLAHVTVPGLLGSRDTPAVRVLAAAVAAAVALVLATPLLQRRVDEGRRAWDRVERTRDEERLFIGRAEANLSRFDRAPLRSDRSVDVVLYVGESTSRWNWSLYGYPRATNAALADAVGSDRLIAFTEAVAPTRGSGDAPGDGLSSLPFLYRERDDAVVPLAHTLARAGIRTIWLAGAGTPWTADSAITGSMRVAGTSRYDESLVASLRDVLDDTLESKLVVLETHAGRFPWCAGVPPSRRAAWSDWMARLPNAAVWGDGGARRSALDCYDAAMRYASETLRDAMRAVDRTLRPTLLVFVANHGEDAWGSLRGDGVARSPRVTDVPLVVYANAAFATHRPDVLTNAGRHRDDLVLTPWLHEALLDVFRVTTPGGAAAFEPRLSIVGRGFDPRADSASLTAARAAGVLPPFMGRDSSAGATLCAHRSNSLFKFLEGSSEYRCAELDVVLDRRDGPAFIHHPPVRSSGLPLFDLLAHAGVPRRGVWLDVKNLDADNAPGLLAHLSALVPAPSRGRVLVETSNDGLARSPVARAFGDSGFVLSYYLPTDLGCACSRDGDAGCARETERLVRMLDGSAFRGVSFDARGRRLARTINARLGSRLVFNAWTPMDRCANGDRPAPLEQTALDSLLGETQKYLVRMPSGFTH